MNSDIRKEALGRCAPVLFTYFIVAAAFGILMKQKGFSVFDTFLSSAFVYTGAFQFVLAALLAEKASLSSIVLTALFTNSRQLFYGISHLKDFARLPKLRPLLIHTLTDETYALNCSLPDSTGDARSHKILYMALACWLTWIAGSVFGVAAASFIPATLKGLDFCLTALFTTIFIDQWKSHEDHRPALLGLGVSFVCLMIFGPNGFILPAMIIVFLVISIRSRYER